MISTAKRSLRTKFLLSLSAVALCITVLGAWATYHIASNELQGQLHQRGQLLASAINHSAMIASNETELAHIAQEVMQDNIEVIGILILSQDGGRTIFEGHRDPASVSQEMSERFTAMALQALETNSFGLSGTDPNRLNIIVPLTTPIGSHDHGHGSAASTQANNHARAQHTGEAAVEPGQHHHHDPGAGATSTRQRTATPHVGHPGSHAGFVTRPANDAMSMGNFGAVLMIFDRQSVMQGLNAILWRLMPTSLVGIAMTLVLCYLLLYHQVLKPIGGIRAAMHRQETGDDTARAEPQSSAEIDDVASALNRMLDTLKEREDTIKHMALTDALTGLANRSMFQRKLQDALVNSARFSGKVALLLIDLDRFKIVNDTHGHPAGDILLQEVSRRLELLTRKNDTVARLGGDEFAVIATGLEEPHFLRRLAGRIIDGIAEGIQIDGVRHKAGASIGISIYPDDARDADELVRLADLALYKAKDAGRGTYHIYDDSLHAQIFERERLERDLSDALDDDQFLLHYQPQIDIKTGRFLGVEALVRWHHPQRGLVRPDEFIPVAEANNQIVPLGEWILSTACRHNRAWQDAGIAPFRIAVNVSPRQMQLKSFADRVADILAETGLSPNWLEIELTETAVMSDIDEVRTNAQRLMQLGVQFAIDDFGTGYSSLTNLRRLPFSKLKIDRSFISELTEDPGARTIAEAVIGIGRNLAITVVAEGVETHEQLALLKTLGCDLAQGYGISRPLHADDLTRWITSQQSFASNAFALAK